MMLYKKTPTGLRQWAIDVSDSTLHITHGKLGGKQQLTKEVVTTNASGRTLDEQIQLRIKSKMAKQYDKGYRSTIEDAILCAQLNAIGLYQPMLAKKISDVKIDNMKSTMIQHKYNGHRCLVHNNGDELIAYSRNGKRITTIQHILDGIDIPAGATLDGELYAHNVKLQTIASWAKRKQEGTLKLKYVVYDHIDTNASTSERIDDLHRWGLHGHIEIAKTHEGDYDTDMLTDFVNDGYEGVIIRDALAPYEPGIRSNALVKAKAKYDDEFIVVRITPSKDGWAILHCAVGNDTFRVTAPGTHEQKYEIMQNADYYLGRKIQIEYYETTVAGKPFHPVALRWRETNED